MRLLFLTDRYWPAIGGVEAMVRTIAGELVRDGHEVRVVAVSNRQLPVSFASYSYAAQAGASYEHEGVRVRVLGASPAQRVVMAPIGARYLPYLRSRRFGELARLGLPFFSAAHLAGLTAAAREADLIHGFGAQYLGATGLKAARRAGIPFLITPFCHPGHWGDDPMNVATYRAADLVFGLHEADLTSYRAMGVAEERLALLPVPVGPMAEPNVRSDRKPYVLYLGRITEYKGIPELFAAWPAVHAATGAELLLAGPNDLTAAPPAGASWLGVVDEATKAELLAGATALALPSRGEILPNVILEAWLQGCPVVVSDIPALAGFVRNEVDALVTATDPLALANALTRCLIDPAMRTRLVGGGRARVTEHSPAVVSAGLLTRYRQVTRDVQSVGVKV